MKIISNFKDYYDCGMSWGQDTSVLFLRSKKEFTTFRVVFPKFKSNRSVYANVYRLTKQKVVGFCGKIYGTLNLNKEDQSVWCYTVEDVDRFVEKYYDDTEKERYYHRPQKGKRRYWKNNPGSTNAEMRYLVEEYFAEIEKFRSKYLPFFVEHGVPIFTAVGNKKHSLIILNDCLKNVSFQKVFDPVMAFQEISMFVGGMAVPQKPMPEISNNDMRDIKGFDEWSFKKEPKK